MSKVLISSLCLKKYKNTFVLRNLNYILAALLNAQDASHEEKGIVIVLLVTSQYFS